MNLLLSHDIYLVKIMLSFLRSKSSDTPVDKIINGTSELSLHTNNEDSAAQMSSVPTTASPQQSSEDLLKSLGYQNANDLRETIYGECFVRSKFKRSCTFIADAFTFCRHFAHDSRSREAFNAWGFACGVRRGHFHPSTDQRQCPSGERRSFIELFSIFLQRTPNAIGFFIHRFVLSSTRRCRIVHLQHSLVSVFVLKSNAIFNTNWNWIFTLRKVPTRRKTKVSFSC